MILDQFKRHLKGKPKDVLMRMRNNALNKKRWDCVAAAEEELIRRYPGWDKPSKRHGPKPTRAMFKDEVKVFETSKEAYVWLIERFIREYPKPFKTIDWETWFIVKCDRDIYKRLYFARSPEKLFYGSDNKEELAGNPSNYVQLSNGWYANLNISNERKLAILRRFSAVAGLKFKKDWS